MTQAHYDALGVGQTEPVPFLGGSSMVADLAATGFTLMRTGPEHVEAFTKLIIRNKPHATLAESAVGEGRFNALGRFIDELRPEPLPRMHAGSIGRG